MNQQTIKLFNLKVVFCCLFVGADLNIFQVGYNWNIAHEACQKQFTHQRKKSHPGI